MPIKPITTGKEQKSIAALQVGDYVAASYTTADPAKPGTFTAIGNVDAGEELYDAADTEKLTGKVYLMKIAPGCLICTTMNMRGTNFTTLNKENYISGKKVTIGGREFLMRVPTGRELMLACSSLHGMLNGDDRYTNFDTAVNATELVQELSNVTPCHFVFNIFPAAYNTNSIASGSPSQARFVLCYVDNNQSVDVFH